METLPGLIGFAAAMSFTPGPNNVLVTASGANFGFRRSLPTLLGVTIGFGLMLVVLGLGANELFRAWPAIHLVLKIAGTAYLLWLAWRIATAGRPTAAGAQDRPLGFLGAAAFQWANPKGWVFLLGALSTYTTVGGDLVAELATITVVVSIACLAAIATWCAFGVAIGRRLRTDRAFAIFNRSMAALLVASIVTAWL